MIKVADENPNEYWAGFPPKLTSQDYLDFVAYTAQEQGVKTKAKLLLTEDTKKELENKLTLFGSVGYQIEKDIQELAKLDETALREKLSKDYLKQEN